MRRAWPPVLAISPLLAGASAAVADDWGAIYDEPASVSFQDDSLISYRFDTNPSSQMRTASDRTLTGSYAIPNPNNQYAIGPPPIAGRTGDHDCVYWVGHSRTRCRHGHIRYANRTMGNSTDDKALVCHEAGHSVGLRHKGATANKESIVRCVWDPVPGSTPLSGRTTSPTSTDWTERRRDKP